MKVRVEETVEMTEDQMRSLANVNDDKVSRRLASRKEAKAYVWEHGSGWALDLMEDWENLFGEDEDEPESESEDEPESESEDEADLLSELI